MAESLYPTNAPKEMYADKKGCKVGDIITVIIVESSTSTSSASTNAKKESSTDVSPGVGGLLTKIPALSTSGGDEMKASGATTRSSQFNARMTVTVKSVDANGNLVIEGSKIVETNKEQEEMKLTGTVRPQDVDPANTVLSTCIADAKITHSGKGPIGSRQREGIISRILRILF